MIHLGRLRKRRARSRARARGGVGYLVVECRCMEIEERGAIAGHAMSRGRVMGGNTAVLLMRERLRDR